MWPSADALPLTAPQLFAPRSRPQYDAENGLTGRHCFAVCAGVGEPRHWLRTRPTVRPSLWRKPAQSGLDGLCDRRVPDGALRRMSNASSNNASRGAATHWSTRTLAKHLGVSKMAIARLESAQTAPSPRNFQAQPRQAVRREASRRGRSILESARARAGAQRR